MKDDEIPQGWKLDSYLDSARRQCWDVITPDRVVIHHATRYAAIRTMQELSDPVPSGPFGGSREKWRIEERADGWAIVWPDGFAAHGFRSRPDALRAAGHLVMAH